jgi:hypothetical protein
MSHDAVSPPLTQVALELQCVSRQRLPIVYSRMLSEKLGDYFYVVWNRSHRSLPDKSNSAQRMQSKARSSTKVSSTIRREGNFVHVATKIRSTPVFAR